MEGEREGGRRKGVVGKRGGKELVGVGRGCVWQEEGEGVVLL